MTRIAVVGDSAGSIRDLIEVLVERGFALDTIRALSGPEQAGETIDVGPAMVSVALASADALHQADVALFCGTGELARELVATAAETTGIVIDATPYSRRSGTGVLVVPEISGSAIERTRKGTVLACAMPTTVGLAVALAPLREVGQVRSVVTTVLEPASQRGAGATERLARQSLALLQGMGLEGDEPDFVAFSLRPQRSSEGGEGWSFDERMLAEEVSTLLGEPPIAVAATIVRSPHFYGIAQSVHVELAKPLPAEEVIQHLRDGRGLLLAEEEPGEDAELDLPDVDLEEDIDIDLAAEPRDQSDEGIDSEDDLESPRRGMRPAPLPGPIDVIGSDAIHVARVRVDPRRPNAVEMWIAYDDVRKGIAQTVAGTLEIALRTRS